MNLRILTALLFLLTIPCFAQPTACGAALDSMNEESLTELARMHIDIINQHDSQTKAALQKLFNDQTRKLIPNADPILIALLHQKISKIITKLQNPNTIQTSKTAPFLEPKSIKSALKRIKKLLTSQEKSKKSFEEIAFDAVENQKHQTFQALFDYQNIKTILALHNTDSSIQDQLLKLLSEFDLSASDFQQNWNINAQDYAEDTLLHIAVAHQNIKFINALLSAQAELTLEDNDGHTPLQLMLKHLEAQELKEIFTQFRINPNSIDSGGDSLLITAASTPLNTNSQIFDLIKVLLTLGANANYQNNHTRESVLHAATEQLFVSSLHNNTDFYQNYALPYTKDLFVTLLNAGADINAQDMGGITPFIKALNSIFIPIKIGQFLLDQGADPTILPNDPASMEHIQAIEERRTFLENAQRQWNKKVKPKNE